MQEMRMDTAFLNFVMASDRVNYWILFEQAAKQRIKSKLGRWIKDFLTNSISKVVVHGATSDDDVLSGVSQGIVLALITTPCDNTFWHYKDEKESICS